MDERSMSLQVQLADIVDCRAEALPGHAWPFESERFAELIASLLHRRFEGDPSIARRLAELLSSAGLLHITALAAPDDEAKVAMKFLLRGAGRTDAEAKGDMTFLQVIGSGIRDRLDGGVHVAVRRYAEALRDDIVAALAVSSDDRLDIELGVAHWLQNAFSLPLLFRSEGVHGFCAASGASFPELVAAADAIGLNVAVLDDILDASVVERSNPEPDVREAKF